MSIILSSIIAQEKILEPANITAHLNTVHGIRILTMYDVVRSSIHSLKRFSMTV